MQQSLHFQEYTEEQLQNDLNQLVQWKNLIPRQESGTVSSIEDFKKKSFVIRQLLIRSKLRDSFGGSLERTLFDRLLEFLFQLTAYHKHPFHESRRDVRANHRAKANCNQPTEEG